MILSLSVGWQDSNVDLWAISCNTKDTESEGTGQKSSDDQVSYFELSVMKKCSLKSKSVWMPLPFIEEALYSVCGTVICLVTVPNVEESGELGVTSITAVEVT